MKNKFQTILLSTLFACIGIAPTMGQASPCTAKRGMTYGKIGAEHIGHLNKNQPYPQGISGGLGHRHFFTARQGIDISAEGSIYPQEKGVYMIGGNVHYVTKPFANKAWYVGAGAMGRYVNVEPLDVRGAAFGPNFIVGREIALANGNTTFIQLDAGAFVNKQKKAIPSVKLSVGYGF